MPQPTRSDVHVNRPLTNISTAYIQSANDFIADKVFPVVSVQKQSDLYFTYPKGEWFRNEVTLRAPSTETAGGGFSVTTDSYRCEKYGLHKDIDDDIIVNADSPLDVERDATLYVTQQLMLSREISFLNSFIGPNIWNGGVAQAGSGGGTGTSKNDILGIASGTPVVPVYNTTQGTVLKWSNAASTPINDITSAALAMTSRTGFRPNTLVLTPSVYNALRQNAQILGRIVYTQRGIITTDIMAAMFDVDRVYVSYAVQNSGLEGAADNLGFIKNDGALLCYSTPTAGLMQPTAGYTFAWAGLFGASAYGNRMKRFREEKINSVRIEGEMSYAQKLVAPDLAVFFAEVA